MRAGGCICRNLAAANKGRARSATLFARLQRTPGKLSLALSQKIQSSVRSRNMSQTKIESLLICLASLGALLPVQRPTRWTRSEDLARKSTEQTASDPKSTLGLSAANPRDMAPSCMVSEDLVVWLAVVSLCYQLQPFFLLNDLSTQLVLIWQQAVPEVDSDKRQEGCQS